MTVATGAGPAAYRHGADRRWARRVAVFAVLVGLWVMHGMSGATDAGCHGLATPLPGTSVTAMGPAGAANSSLRTGVASVVAGAESADPMSHGDLCHSAQPPTAGSALFALLALLALTIYAVDRREQLHSRLIGALCRRWRAPPGPLGICLLTMVCVSRM